MSFPRTKFLAHFLCVLMILAVSGAGKAQSGTGGGSFGTVAIGQASTAQPVTLTFTGGGTLASQLALTAGAEKQDFAIVSGGSCTTGQSYQTGGSCTVSVTFAPLYAGLRMGAVVLEDASGAVLASSYISGVGSGPQAGFHVTTRQLTTFPYLTFAADRGIAVDGSGNLFAASINSGGASETVVEVPVGCTTESCVKQLPGTYTAVRGLAVDGAGNLWVGDIGANNSITEIVAAGGYSTTKVYTGSFGLQVGVAVDGAGNVYFTGESSGSAYKVTELTASSGYTTAQILASGYNALGGIAVDSLGDVFFADQFGRVVQEIVAVNGSIPSTPTVKPLGSGIINVSGLALDGGGNIYTTGTDSSGFGVIFELPAASGYATVNQLSNQTNPIGIALDAGGDLFGIYYTNQALGGASLNSIFELPMASAPSLIFSTPTAPGEIDTADGPHKVYVDSIGNQPLSLAGLKVSNANFSLDASTTTCTATSTLAVGDSCLLAIVFNPLTTGNITGTLTVTDNTLNAASVKQSIALQGTSQYTPLVSVSLAAYVVAVSQALPVTVTVNGGSGNPIPTGTILITAPGYSSAPLTLSGGSASVTIPAGTLSPGQPTLTAAYQPDAASAPDYMAASVITTFVVTSTIMNVPTITVTPAVNSISLGQALTVTVAVGQVGGAPMPTGSVSLAGGNYTSPATTLSSGTVTITIPANSLVIGTDGLIATYTPDAASATIYVAAKGEGFVAVGAAPPPSGAAPVDFGSLVIGKTSAAQAIALTFPANSTPATLIATTLGATGLDFAIVSGGSCGAGVNVAAGQSCTVNVVFTPAFAGVRSGAVVAEDADGHPLALTYVHGSGTGAQISIQSDYYSGYSGVYATNYPFSFTTLSDGFSHPNVAVDGAGNIFVADMGPGAVREIPAGCTSSSCVVTVLQAFYGPTALAVDGAGNIFVTETGFGDVKKIPLGCKSFSCMETVGTGFNQPYGVAVDASGNVFVADTFNNAIKEVVAAGGYSTIKTLASGLDLPWSVVVNAGGDLFVAEGGDQCQPWIPGSCLTINTSLLQITAASDYKTINTLSAGGFGKPFGLAIDGAGNVYEADYGDECANEFTAGSGYATARRLCSTSWFIYPEGMAVDGPGNLYLDDVIKGAVYKMDYVDVPSMTFRTATLKGVADAQDGSQVVSVQNNGTAPLTFSSIALSDTSFKLDSTVTTCSTSTPLAAGSSCYLAVDFAPTTTGPIPGTLTLTNNNLNQSPATQVIQIAAVALPPVPVILTNPVNPTTATSATFTFSDTQTPITFVCSIDSLPYAACASPANYSALSGGPHAFQVKAKDTAGNLSLAAVYNWQVNSVGPPAPLITSAPAYLTSEDTATFTFTDTQAGVSYQCSLDGAAFTACTSGISYSGLAPGGPTYEIHILRHSFAVKAKDASSNFSPETARGWTVNSYHPSAYPVDFGLVAVGQTSSAQNVTFNIGTAATVATIDALTMGIPGLDFAVSDAGTCAVGTALAKGATCTLKATITPKYPGQRKGAVLVLDAAGNGIGEAYLQGTGTAPQVTFGPFSTVYYNILAAQNNTDHGKDMLAPVSDVAVDGAGNVFAVDMSLFSADQSIAISTGDIWKFAPGCTGPTCSTLVATERNATPTSSYLNPVYLILPTGMTMDGAGALWVSNYYLYPEVLDTVGSWYNTQCTYIAMVGNYSMRTVVDGAGDAALIGNGKIQSCFMDLGIAGSAQLKPASHSKTQDKPEAVGGGGSNSLSFDFSSSTPSLTVDPQNNYFVADAGNNAIKEVLASSNYTIDRTVGSGFSTPTGVASDAYGNIYVSDTGNHAIKEIIAASGFTQVVTIATFDSTMYPGNLAVDSLGNLYVATTTPNWAFGNTGLTNQFFKLGFSDAPALNFPTATKIGSSDTTDGTLIATVKNNGNQPLTIGGLALSTTNFSIDASATTCSASAPLAVGASCTVGVTFTPNATGALTGTLTLTDNALNASGATQKIALTGTGFSTPTTSTPAVAVAPASASITTAQSDLVTVTVSRASGKPTPTGSISLFGGSYTSPVVALSGGKATFTIPAGMLAVGSTTLNAVYSPDAASSTTYGTGAGSAAIIVSAVPASTPTVTVTPAAVDVSTQQSLAVTIAVSGGSGNPTPTGSVTLSGGNYASQAATLSNGSATITIPAGYLPAGTVTLTAYYTPDPASQANYASASGTGQVAVEAAAKITPAVAVTPTASSIVSNQSLQVTMQVSGGISTPTGSIVLSSGGFTSATAALSQGSVIVSIPAGALAVGGDTLTASYTPDSASTLTFNSAAGSASVAVSAPVTTGAFGSIPVGQTSSAIMLTFNFTGSGTIGSISAFMQGAPASDFAVISGGTCAASMTYISGDSCTANVTFSPKFAGTRFGAVIVKDSSGNTVAIDLVNGIGLGPQVRLIPKYASTAPPWPTLGGGLSTAGIAVDGIGDVFVVDTNSTAVVAKEVPAGCASAACVITLAPTYTLGTKPTKGQSIALDASGNVFVATSDGGVFEITAASGYQTAIALAGGFAFTGPTGLAVDQSGNVFVAAGANGGTYNGVYEIPAAGGYATVNQVGIGLTSPIGLAIDMSGNLFVSTMSNGTANPNGVYEIPASGGYTTFKAVGSGFSFPQGIAVDQSGNVWVLDQSYYGVYEILAEGGYTNVEALKVANSYYRIAVDASGNLYAGAGAGSTIDVLNFTNAGVTFWSQTPVGSTDTTDGTRTVTVQNIGNETLNLSGIAPPSADFSIDSGATTCSSSSVLAAGASCVVGMDFKPAAAGALTGTLTLTDDALNVTGATQNIYFSGTGVAVTVATATQLQASATSVAYGASVTFSVTVTPASGTVTPTGSVVLMDGTTTLTTLTLNASGGASYSTTALGTGAHSITAVYGGDANNQASTSAAVTVTVAAPLVATTTTLQASASSITAGASLTLTATVVQSLSPANAPSGYRAAANAATVPTGTVAFLDGTTTLGSVSLNASGAASFSTAALGAGSHSITASYSGDNSDAPSTSTAVTVTVAAAVPAVSLTPSSLSFTAASGTTSAGQSIALANTGTAALNIAGISIGGTNASAFAQTNTCGEALNAGSNCAINVTFTPTSAASFSATLSVTDNAGDSPQTVALSGTGTPAPSFTIGSTTSSQSVQPGSIAGFTITVTPQNGAFNNAVTFTASGLPPGATASFSPSTVTPGSAAATTQMSIQTAATTAQGHRTPLWPAGTALALIGFLFLPRARRRQWLAVCILFLASLGALTLSACGGGFALKTTSATTYTITVTGASGNTTQTTTVQLTVE